MSTLAEQVAAYKATGNKQAKADAAAPKESPKDAKVTPPTEPSKVTTAKPAEAKKATSETPAQAPEPKTAKPLMTGHPLDTASPAPIPSASPEPAKTPEAAAPSAPPAVETKPLLTYAGKNFQSAEEVVAYIAELERDKAAREAYAQGLKEGQPQPTAPAEPEVKLEELIFEDPARALAIIRESAIREVRQEFATRDTRAAQERQIQSAWDRFYSANPRLKEFPEIVNSALTEIISERGANFDIEAGLKMLGERSLQRLDIYRDRLSPAATETVLPTTPAVVASAGLAATPTAPDTTAQLLSFTDQVRSLRKRGAKS